MKKIILSLLGILITQSAYSDSTKSIEVKNYIPLSTLPLTRPISSLNNLYLLSPSQPGSLCFINCGTKYDNANMSFTFSDLNELGRKSAESGGKVGVTVNEEKCSMRVYNRLQIGGLISGNIFFDTKKWNFQDALYRQLRDSATSEVKYVRTYRFAPQGNPDVKILLSCEKRVAVSCSDISKIDVMRIQNDAENALILQIDRSVPYRDSDTVTIREAVRVERRGRFQKEIESESFKLKVAGLIANAKNEHVKQCLGVELMSDHSKARFKQFKEQDTLQKFNETLNAFFNGIQSNQGKLFVHEASPESEARKAEEKERELENQIKKFNKVEITNSGGIG